MKSKTKSHSRIKWFFGTVIVTTVLASIILPSLLPFFETKVCARSPVGSSSAKFLLGVINRYQQAYYLEHGHFVSSIQQVERELETGINPDKYLEDYWEASIQVKDDVAFAYAVAKDANQDLYSYVSAATAYTTTDDGMSIICRTIEPSTAQPAAPILQRSRQFIFWRQDAKFVCASGTDDC